MSCVTATGILIEGEDASGRWRDE